MQIVRHCETWENRVPGKHADRERGGEGAGEYEHSVNASSAEGTHTTIMVEGRVYAVNSDGVDTKLL